MKTKQKLLLALLSFCTLHFSLSTASAQGTAFTYQGQLSAGGNPATGNYDFTFALFNTNSTNTGQVGATLTNLDVSVSNGLFTVVLDFGANFPGASRWLAIGVRTNGGSSFTALSPLQELTPAPYAIYAPNAGNAATATGATSVSSGITITNVLLTNAVITNSIFGGNGGGLTNLSVSGSQLTSIGNSEAGYDNFFAGPSSGNPNNTGFYNTAYGTVALPSSTTGSDNVAFGYEPLFFDTTGSDNIGLGFQVLFDNRSGNQNIAIGTQALLQLGQNGHLGGTNNIALGYQAGISYITNESGNIDIGSSGAQGENNTIHLGGSQTMTYIAGVINFPVISNAVVTNSIFGGNGGGLTNLSVSGSQLTSIGNSEAGYENFFAGPSSGNPNNTGFYNTAYGTVALPSSTTGSDNVAFGYEPLFFDTTGSDNIGLGFQVLFDNRSGNQNIAIGTQALWDLGQNGHLGGTNNIALGYQAGISYTTNESGNIDIGSAGAQGENNTIHLGGTQTMTYIAGVINGNGSGLTSLNAAQLSGSIPSGVSVPAVNLTGAGTLPGAVLPGNVALLNGNQTFTNVDTFSNGLTVATSAGSLALINDGGAVPGITATGGLAVGHMRLRNAMEVWPNAAQTSAGYLDVRNTANNATISLTGSSGAIVCSNVTANGVVLTSDRNAKQNFTPLDPEATLAKVSAMPVTEWSYKSDPASTKHIGPMAQDFHAAFGLNGTDDKHISVVDEGGVALAAIQGLNQKLNEKDAEIEKLKKQLDDLTATVKLLAARK